MARFVAVIHQWFMDSNSFVVETIEATNRDDAEIIADAMAHRRRDAFNRTAAQVVEFGADEVLMPRKQSWRERLSGHISDPTPAARTEDGE